MPSIITNGTDYTFSEIFLFQNWRVSRSLDPLCPDGMSGQVDTGIMILQNRNGNHKS